MRYSIIAAMLPALAACQQPAARPPVTEAQAEQIASAAEATFTTGDLGKIMDQYADNAVMIDASTADPSTDRKVQAGWAKNFVSMKPADYQVAGRHIQLIGPDAFVSSGIERFTVEAGAARPTVSARFIDVFQRQKDGKWKIISEHVSMPPTPSGQL
ncbi:nuclear transport factor 2 family protein [Sphingomonas sp.]|uniref:nuclear transport factor 2 family protein n=1 Tax=Sphingomonas sp. TaxID=28214 RepID=UPI00286CD54A|nr:nuclear transport factor 2 family protein [Sphingomonas sp.]